MHPESAAEAGLRLMDINGFYSKFLTCKGACFETGTLRVAGSVNPGIAPPAIASPRRLSFVDKYSIAWLSYGKNMTDLLVFYIIA